MDSESVKANKDSQSSKSKVLSVLFKVDNANVLTSYTDSPEENSYQNSILYLVETPDGDL